MTEIERMIENKITGLRFFNVIEGDKKRSYEMDKQHVWELSRNIAKTLEQYVNKARIEELENFKKYLNHDNEVWFFNKACQRIAELKKG